MTTTRKRRRRNVDAASDPTLSDGDVVDDSPVAALERILSHAESHGEAYDGATEDHAIVRAAIEEGSLAGDRRGLAGEGSNGESTK